MDDYKERYDKMRKSLKELVNDYLLRSIILDYDGRYAGSAINFIKDLYGDILAMFHERFRLMEKPYNLIMTESDDNIIYQRIKYLYHEELREKADNAYARILCEQSDKFQLGQMAAKFPTEAFLSYVNRLRDVMDHIAEMPTNYKNCEMGYQRSAMDLFTDLIKGVNELIGDLTYEVEDYCSAIEDKFLNIVFERDWYPRFDKLKYLKVGDTTKEYVFCASFFRNITDLTKKSPFISTSLIVPGVKSTYEPKYRHAACIFNMNATNIALMSLSDGNTFINSLEWLLFEDRDLSTLENPSFTQKEESSRTGTIFEVDRRRWERAVQFKYAYGDDTFKIAPFDWYCEQLRKRPDAVNETVLRDYCHVEGFLVKHTCPEHLRELLMQIACRTGKRVYLWDSERDLVTRLA